MLLNFLLYTLNLGDLVTFYGFCQLFADNSQIRNSVSELSLFLFSEVICLNIFVHLLLEAIHYKHVQIRTHLFPTAGSPSCLGSCQNPSSIQNALCWSLASLSSGIQGKCWSHFWSLHPNLPHTHKRSSVSEYLQNLSSIHTLLSILAL